MSTRVASHAGSWYDSRASVLSKQLQGWLDAAKKESPPTSDPVKAVIAPHAGYSYSGPTAAFAYAHLNPSLVRRVFILGPSHHHYTKQAELSAHSHYSTPLSSLPLDLPLIADLHRRAPHLFSPMSSQVDEDEHSLEMQLPYIAQCVASASQPPTLVPILVGALSPQAESELAALLLPHFLAPDSFFVVSSDFCHWGQRFGYTQVEKGYGAIHEYIRALDHEGMELVERVDRVGWGRYLKEKKNTVCGRYPIGVLVALMEKARGEGGRAVKVDWVRYAQSSAVVRESDSSVSYASAIVVLEPKGDQGKDEAKSP